MKKVIIGAMCVVLSCGAVFAGQTLKFADILTDNMVLQRGKEIKCWGTASAGSEVQVLLTQSRDEAERLAGEKALERESSEKKPAKDVPGLGKVKLSYVDEAAAPLKSVTKTVKAGKDGRWEVSLGVHEASFTPTYIAAKSGDESVAIQNLLIGEVWIASGQSNMSWGNSRANMWEKRGMVFPGIRFARVGGDSYEPRESFAGEGKSAPWIVCEDGAVGGVSAIGYIFGQYLHRQLKVPVGVVVISQGGSFAREWCSREVLEKMDSPTVDAGLKAYDEKANADEAPKSWRGPASLFNARLYPIRKMAVAGVIYMQGENESLCGAVPQYVKTFPGVIKSYRDALQEPELPFGIITLQGYGGYQSVREIHYKTHEVTPNTGYIVAHDIGGNIHPTWKRPLGERAVYWALRDVYGIVTGGSQLRVKDVSFADGKAKVVFARRELKSGNWIEGKPTVPWTNDQQPPAGFEIAGEDRAWYRARIARGRSPEDGLTLSHAMVSEPVAVRYAWGGFPCGNLGSWEDPMPPYRSDDWPVMGPDAVAGEGDGPSEAEKGYAAGHERKNREYEMGLRLAVAESYENLAKRYAHPKGMLRETVKNMQDLMAAFDPGKAEEIAPALSREALHKIPTRYWRRDRYSPARRAKWSWLIDRVLRLPGLPEEMEEAVNDRGLKKQLAQVEEALEGLQAEIEKLDDPEPMEFDDMLDKVLAVMEKEKERLAEEEGIEFKWGGELNRNPF